MFTVLFVDDEPRVLRSIIRSLKGKLENCKLMEAQDAREAVILIRMVQPNLVITDWEMPGGGGRKVTSTAKKFKIPAYIHSGTVNIKDENAHGIIVKGESYNAIESIIKLAQEGRL